jgi:hypothetical protein
MLGDKGEGYLKVDEINGGRRNHCKEQKQTTDYSLDLTVL